jgi:N-sulfoglucosamine sulfohydrolase
MPRQPEAVAPGTVNGDLVEFIDFAPTMLSLAGVSIPRHIQGRAFLGQRRARPRDYVYGARDRMDEAYDLIRTVRDKRFRYIRNYMWYVSRGQDINYMNQMPTMQEMRRLHAEGKLQGPQAQYFEPTKPVEELYDTAADPHEVNNLADDPNYSDVLNRMRAALADWYRRTMDIGLIPEPIFDEMKRPGGEFQKTDDPVFIRQAGGRGKGGVVMIACATRGASIAWRIGGDPKSPVGWRLYTAPVPLEPGEVLHARACRIGFRDSGIAAFELGDSVSPRPRMTHTMHWSEGTDLPGLCRRLAQVKESDHAGPNATSAYLAFLKDSRPAVRYWAAVGLHASTRFPVDIGLARPALMDMLKDSSAVVRIAAAHTLCDWGQERIALPVLIEALKHRTDKTRMFAMVALDKIGEKARPALPQIQAAVKDSDDYVTRVARTVLARLEAK